VKLEVVEEDGILLNKNGLKINLRGWMTSTSSL
jgi:hypothetical protein